jgi:diguanylate cyclase (GGDEF)-like protein
MKTSRILILQEEPDRDREQRLTLLDRSVDFHFMGPEDVEAGRFDPSPFAAILVPIECARPGLIGRFSDPSRCPGPVILYRGNPPLHEVARWVIWGEPIPGEAGDGSVADRLLTESLEYYRMASMYQQCLQMMSTQDEEKLLAQIAETFGNALGAESCVIWLASRTDPDEMLIASVRGVIGIDGEGSRFFLSQTDTAEAVWKGAPFLCDTGGRPGDARDRGKASHLFVPLVVREKPIGLVKLGERGDRSPYGERELYIARIIAEYAAAALDTMDRLGRIEKISLRDPETGAYSAAFLSDYFEKERYKAGRFHRPLSVVFLVIENYAYLMEKTRESIVVAALSGMVESIRKAVRDSDLVAREDANRFCIVLPETDSFGAMLAVRRLRKAVREKCSIQFLGADYSLQPFFLSATCPRDGREFQELLRVAEEKFARQQKSPLHRMRLSDRTLWDAFDILVGKPEHYELLRRGEDVPYFSRFRKDLGRNVHFSVPRETWLRILESVAQDVAATTDDRGLVIAAGPTPEIYKQIFLSFETETPGRRNIYIVGQNGSTRFDAKNLMYVAADDESLKDRGFLLYLKESGAYGLFCTDRGEEVDGFNTADEWLVESMIEKAQKAFLLQGNF